MIIFEIYYNNKAFYIDNNNKDLINNNEFIKISHVSIYQISKNIKIFSMDEH